MHVWHHAPDSLRALTASFFARFFENEITTSIDDLKGSFFWLLAALAIPGMFIPWVMAFDWHLIAAFKGPEALREASQAEKVFYLGFAMIASGLLTAITWSTLLPDERDALVLGTLPVNPGTIVAAKLTALGGYLLLVSVAMHAIGAVFFGTVLATKASGLFALRGILAHFVAACAASAGVALVVSAVQGLTLAVGGPRVFRRAALALQVALVFAIAVGLTLLPVITSSIVHTVRGFGARAQPWILSTPPAWFLGLYEWILGTSDPVHLSLARNAGLLLLAAGATTIASYPLAYRRLMVSAVERRARPTRHVVATAIRGALVAAAGRNPEARAAADFYTATISRVERHRFALAMAAGVAVAWSLTGWKMMDAPTLPEPAWLSLPISAMILVTAGLRIAASLPGDLRAGWLFELQRPSRAHARRALERTMFLLGVLPPALLAAAVFWWLWGRDVALVHTAVSMALGAAVLELLLWHTDGMPCGQQWNLSGATLGYRWPFYPAAFFVITIGVPRLEVLLIDNRPLAAIFVGLLLCIAVIVRHAASRRVILPSYDDVDPVAGVLRLN